MIKFLRGLMVVALAAPLLALAASPADAGTRWDGTRWDAASPTAPACAPTNRAVISHTLTGTHLEVTVKKDVILCDPITVTFAAYTYDGTAKYGQTLANKQTLVIDRGVNLFNITRPPGCAIQADVILGEAPPKLTDDKTIKRFLHEVSAGTFPSYWHDTAAPCVKVTPTPKPPVKVVPTPTPRVTVKASTPPVTAPAPVVPVPVAQTLPVTGGGVEIIAAVAMVCLIIGGALAVVDRRHRRMVRDRNLS